MTRKLTDQQKIAVEMCDASIAEAVTQLQIDRIKDQWIGYCLIIQGVIMINSVANKEHGKDGKPTTASRVSSSNCIGDALAEGMIRSDL